MHAAFHSLSSFLAMGRNGNYVWSAYAIVLVVLLFALWISTRRNA